MAQEEAVREVHIPLPRRDFLKITAAASGSLILFGCRLSTIFQSPSETRSGEQLSAAILTPRTSPDYDPFYDYPDDIKVYAQRHPEQMSVLINRARSAYVEENIHDEIILRQYGSIEKPMTAKDAVTIMVRYHRDIETNPVIDQLLKECDSALPPVDRLLHATMRAKDFADGTIPEVSSFALDNIIFGPALRGTWGGGLGEHTKSGRPAVINGPYADTARVQTDYRQAFENTVRTGIHEKGHGIQGLSKSDGRIVVFERDGYTNFRDPRSIMSHEAMGLLEYLGGRGVGIQAPEWISWRIFFVADRLIRNGKAAQEATLLLLQSSVHGTSSDMIRAYENARRAGDPSFEELFTDQKSPDQWILPNTPDIILQSLCKLARIAQHDHFEISVPPPMVPLFEGNGQNGRISPMIRRYDSTITFPSLDLDFSPGRWESRDAFADSIGKIMRDLDNTKYDSDPLAWLLRADRDVIFKLNAEWKKLGSPRKVTYDVFVSMLKSSPLAFRKWREIENGPTIELPKPDGRKLYLTIPPNEWNVPRVAQCMTNATWFMPVLTQASSMKRYPDGIYRGQIQVGSVYMDSDGKLIVRCPESAVPTIWKNGKRIQVGYWK